MHEIQLVSDTVHQYFCGNSVGTFWGRIVQGPIEFRILRSLQRWMRKRLQYALTILLRGSEDSSSVVQGLVSRPTPLKELPSIFHRFITKLLTTSRKPSSRHWLRDFARRVWQGSS